MHKVCRCPQATPKTYVTSPRYTFVATPSFVGRTKCYENEGTSESLQKRTGQDGD